MSELLNGFNNGRDTTEGIGGQKRIDQIANGVITGAEQCNLPVVNVRYCWLRPDGEYSEHKYRQIEEIDDFEKEEANNNNWKLIKLEEVDF